MALMLAGCGTPQMGPDRDAFRAVDALYTAVSLRDPALLDQCAGTLRELRSAGKLPEDAAAALDGFIDEAKAGRWEPSQERLARFMEAQRR
jgi:hypothetical protein